MFEKRKNFKWKHVRAMTKRQAFIGNNLQLQNLFQKFNLKNVSLPSVAGALSRQPKAMAHKTTAFWNKLISTDFKDCGKCQDRFGEIFWLKKPSSTGIENSKI